VATKRSRSGAITSLELKRRNSDPATKCGTLIRGQPAGMDTPAKVSDVLEWKGNTMFTIAGHRFRKVARFSKEDKCVSCDKSMDAFVTQGHKCSGKRKFLVCWTTLQCMMFYDLRTLFSALETVSMHPYLNLS
jgi:hypothetical protein